MDIDKLRDLSFISPKGDNLDYIEKIFHDTSKMITLNAASSNVRSPLPNSSDIINKPLIPKVGINYDDLLKIVESYISKSMNPNNDGYIGHMDTIASVPSIIGDFAAGAVNNNMLSLEMSPVFSKLEAEMIKEIAYYFGLGEKAGGVFTSGGTLANLQALTVARNFYFDSLNDGITNLHQKPVILTSEASHSSIKKVAMILGLGKNAVKLIKTDQNSRMDIEELKREYQTLKDNGYQPFCVVGTAGTTVTGNIDNLKEIASFTKENNVWFHVDAAYGGALAFSNKYKKLLSGIEEADSITFNPQKWLYIAKTAAMVIFRDFDILRKNFQIEAPYMKENDQFINLGEISIQGTRHADILKVYLAFQHFGLNGYDELINYTFEHRDTFISNINKREYLQILSTPETNIVCFRGFPKWLSDRQINEWNNKLQEYLLSKGYFLSLPKYKGEIWLRAVLLNPFTTKEKIDNMFNLIDNYYEKLK